MPKTKAKTQVVTNTQLAVAVFAAFLAGGLAFAGAPAQNRLAAAPKCGVNSYSVVNMARGCASGQYTGIDFSCHDGSRHQHRPGACTPLAQLKNTANATCANRCAGVPQPPVVATGTAYIKTFNYRETDYHTQFFTLGETIPAHLGVEIKAGLEEDITIRDLSFDLLRGSYLSYENARNPQGEWTTMEDLESLTVNLYSSDGQRLLTRGPIQTNDDTRANVEFDNINLIVKAGESKNLYFGIESQSKSTSTVFSFSFPMVRATGGTTGARIDGIVSPLQVEENRWPVYELLPVQLNVASNFQNGRLALGQQDLFTFTVGASQNSNGTNGEAVPATLKHLILALNKDDQTELNNIELCRTPIGICIPLDITSTSHRGELVLGNYDNFYGIDIEAIEAANRPFFQEVPNDPNFLEFTLRANVIPGENGFVQTRLIDGNFFGVRYGFDANANGTEDRYMHYISNYYNQNNPDIIGGPLVSN